MSDGLALIVIGVEEEIDPMLDPVLEKQFITKGLLIFPYLFICCLNHNVCIFFNY
jgi:hypothetical protein